jgi:uncharacterized membrane protein
VCDQQEFAAIRDMINPARGGEPPDEDMPNQPAPDPRPRRQRPADAPASVYSEQNIADLDRNHDRLGGASPQGGPQTKAQLILPDFEFAFADGESAAKALPPPEVIEHYEQIYPGAAEQIFTAFSQHQATLLTEQRHRHQIESATLRAKIERTERAQVLMAVLAGLLLLSSLAVLWTASQTWAAAIGAVAILVEISALTFLYIREVAGRSPKQARLRWHK